MAERNRDVPDDRRIEFRIGINLGDVIIEGDDIYGDGVNIAARLEALAEPGGIFVSRAVRDPVRDKLDIVLEDLGEKPVKNIARPVRVFRIGRAERRGAARARRRAVPDKPSIAVLPFANMSGDPEQEYFTDGITEDIITDLSKVSGAVRDRPQLDVHLQGQVGRRCRRSAASSACASCSKAASARPATACASPRSSSTPRAAAICGPSATTAS